MYKILLVTALFPFILFAQPSDAEIKQRAISAGAIATKFTTEKGTVHTTITEKWYMRTMESKWKTEYPGVFRWERTEYRYDFAGGKWVFKRTYLNSSWYEGIPNPSEAEVVKLVKSQLDIYLKTAGRVIGEPESIKLAADPKWNWESMRKTTCITEAVYTEKINEIGDAQKVKQKFAVSMFRSSDNKNAPFESFFSVTEGEPVVLEKIKIAVKADESPFKSAEDDSETQHSNIPSKEPDYPSYSINDLVLVNWNGQNKDYYKGKVVKTDPYNVNRYFIEFEEIQSAWIEAKHISKRNEDAGKKNANTQLNTSDADNTELKVGDKVKANWKNSGRWFPGKIAAKDPLKKDHFLIKYDDGDQEWTTKDKIQKQ